MNKIPWSRRTRALLALGAATLAAGTAVGVASPAQAALAEPAEDALRYCLVVMPDPGIIKCFDNPGPLDAFEEQAIVGPAKQGPSSGTAASTRSGLTAALTPLWLLSKEYTGYFHTGNRLDVYGTAGPCTTTTADIDYELSSYVGTIFNQSISSFKVYNNCWARHYDNVNFGAPFVGYQGGQAVISATVDDDTSSERWS